MTRILTNALEPDSETEYTNCDFTRPVLLVFGSESKGLRPGVWDKCQEHVRIPVHGQVQSLNVSASVAAVVFEVVRQRMKMASVPEQVT